jgi:sulfur-oxidizing protein SoxY
MNTDMKRRSMLKGTLAASVVGIAAGAGLLTPREVLAAWPKAAFEAKGVDAAMQELTGSGSLTASKAIDIKAPPIAENGAVVGVTVSTGLKNVESISILVEKNPSPLTSSWNLAANTEPFVGTRIKVSKTSSVIAVCKTADGKLYSAGREVKVTIGGCGG